MTTGSLPPGLQLGTDGHLTGAPTTIGTYSFTVKADNAGGIMAQTDVDGALVGGASIDADSFAGCV